MGAANPAEEPIQLLKKIVDRDKDAFGRFYDRFAPLAFSLALRIVRNHSDAEEVVQDVFYQIWVKASNFKQERGTPEAWLVTLTRSRAIDRLRAKNRRDKNVQSSETVPEALFPSHKGNSAAVDARMDIQGPLSELPEPQREALELAYFKGMTQTEIALHTGVPLGTVKTRMRDGLIRLRELVAAKNMEKL